MWKPVATVVLLWAAAGPAPASAAVTLASPFASHMVVQRDRPVPVWGRADAGADVAVRLGSRRATARADAGGRWSATLDALPAGGPFTLSATAGTATAQSTAAADDVLVGDVWLCTGQSNLQYGLHEAADGPAAAATAGRRPLLRLGRVALATAGQPRDQVGIDWQPSTPATAASFSAVGYFFARELYDQDPALATVPIGLLQDCLGGTTIESWMPAAALAGFDRHTLASSMFGIGPSALYNGMVAPLGTLPLRGVVWYQGEGNAGEPARYRQYLPLMIGAWRRQFAQPELPFLVVQLPDYTPDWNGLHWQWTREAQAAAAAAVPHAAVAVSIGTNDGSNLHPQGKHEIARRLALLAREVAYGEPVAGRSPSVRSATVEGPAVRVTFDTDRSPLAAGTGPVEGFTVAGDDGRYRAAEAAVVGPDAVVVRSAEVPVPKTVRYAWAGVPRATLATADGLPVAPFRTDDRPPEKPEVEAQPAPVGYAFAGRDYQLAVDGNGRASGLVVRGQQLLSNAAAPWGGTNLSGQGGNLTPSGVARDGPDRLTARAGPVSETVDLTADGVRWTVANGSADPVRFTVSLSPLATVDEGPPVTVHRKGAAVTVTGVDSVATATDVAADDGAKVLVVAVPAGGSRTVGLTVP